MVEEFEPCFAEAVDRKCVWLSHVELNSYLLPMLDEVVESAKHSKSGLLRRDPVLSNLLH